MKLKRSDVNKLLNLALYLLCCLMLASGLVLYFRFPHPARGAVVWGITKHTWGEAHAIIGLATAVGAGLHLWLHWRWLTQVAAQGGIWKLYLGLGAGLALIFAAVIL